MNNNLPKIVVILGPTASGKTDLAIYLAKKFNGEIISADSRQIYKQMNIGTAKPKADFGLRTSDHDRGAYMVEGVPHYLMDIIEPDEDFSLADFKKLALEKINEIHRRNKLPILVGGTGLYIWAIVDNLDIPAVAPDQAWRRGLEEKSLDALIHQLQTVDPETAAVIDLKNPRRVIRALEVALGSGGSFVKQRTKSPPLFDVLPIGIDWPREKLYSRINLRVDWQIKEGLVEETKALSKEYSWSLPSMSSIGYRQIGEYLRGEVSLAEAILKIKQDTRHYAKRQMTWFKRDKRIVWLDSPNKEKAERLISDFQKKEK